MKEEILRMERVTLMYEGAAVLNNVNINIFRGEVVGLMCVNAHGQEELLGLMLQNTPIHFGRIYFGEKLVNNHMHSSLSYNPAEIVEKESHLVDSLTVADNVLVLQNGFRGTVIPSRRLNKQLLSYTAELGVDIDGNRYADELSVFDRCVIEILKAVQTGKCLIILRNLSSFLCAAELEKIYDIMRRCTGRGVSFLYVCNHPEELFRFCDRVAVMENGKIQKIVEKPDMETEAFPFPGQPVYARKEQAGAAPGPAPALGGPKEPAPVLQFSRVGTEHIADMSFSVYPGERLVLLTADEEITSDISELLLGERRPLSGEILACGRAMHKPLRSEIAVVDEKPVQRMLFPHLSYLDNLCFTSDERIRAIWRSRRLRKSVIREYREIVGDNIDARDIRNLSAKELYRLIYYRIYFQHPRVAVIVKPFSTIDLSLRLYVSELIRQFEQKGIAVLILTSSLSGLLPLADRLLTVRDGRVESELSRDEFSYVEKAP